MQVEDPVDNGGVEERQVYGAIRRKPFDKLKVEREERTLARHDSWRTSAADDALMADQDEGRVLAKSSEKCYIEAFPGSLFLFPNFR